MMISELVAMRSQPRNIGMLLFLIVLSGCAERDPLDQADELISRKRYSHAVVIYDQILAENPKSAAALIGRGRAHAAAGKPELAIEDFSAAMVIDPRRSEAFYRRAMVYESLGDHAAAKADEESAHAIDPDYRWAFANVQAPGTPKEKFDDEDEFEDASTNAEPEPATISGGVPTSADETFDTLWFQTTNSSLRQALRGDGDDVPPVPLRRRSNAEQLRSYEEPWIDKGSATSVNGTEGLVGRFQTPFWLRPDSASHAKPVSPKQPMAPKAVTRPPLVPNPYVRSPAPTAAGAGPSIQQPPQPANNGSGRPVGTPFPQKPVPSTGRKS